MSFADIESKINLFWSTKKSVYQDALAEENPVYPVTTEDLVGVATREFIWWFSKNSMEIENRDEIMNWIFSEEGMKSINTFFKTYVVPRKVWKEEEATDKQKKYIGYLSSQLSGIRVDRKKAMTKGQAHEIIEYLQNAGKGKWGSETDTIKAFVLRD